MSVRKPQPIAAIRLIEQLSVEVGVIGFSVEIELGYSAGRLWVS
jgi:hypothetical protein